MSNSERRHSSMMHNAGTILLSCVYGTIRTLRQGFPSKRDEPGDVPQCKSSQGSHPSTSFHSMVRSLHELARFEIGAREEKHPP